MPLSEGATRARHARRLLQRVLDFVPEGTTIHPIVRIGRHAAEGIVEAAAEQEADLLIFGWGGKTPSVRDGKVDARANGHRGDGYVPVISPTIDEVVRESPADIAVVKQRGSSELKRILVPVRGGPHAELALRFADALARRHDGEIFVLHLVPPGITLAVRAQAERALTAFVKQHVSAKVEARVREAANVRNAILREATLVDLVVMGASAGPGADGDGADVLLDERGERALRLGATARVMPGGTRWRTKISPSWAAGERIGKAERQFGMGDHRTGTRIRFTRTSRAA